LGGDEIGDGGAKGFAVACKLLPRDLATHVLADRDIFHFRGDNASAGVVHLRDIAAGLGAEHALADVGEGLDTARPVGAELTVVLGTDVASEDFLDVAAAPDPVAPELVQAGHDVDARAR